MGRKKINAKRNLTRIPTPKQMLILEIAILLMSRGIEPTAKKIYDFTVLQNKQDPSKVIPVTIYTLNYWFQHENFRKWFDKAIADRIRKEMNIDARNLLFVDKMWKLAMTGTEAANMRAADIYARISGLYQDITNINIDNSKKTINISQIPTLEDLENSDILFIDKAKTETKNITMKQDTDSEENE
jgi:hypothetical protein